MDIHDKGVQHEKRRTGTHRQEQRFMPQGQADALRIKSAQSGAVSRVSGPYKF